MEDIVLKVDAWLKVRESGIFINNEEPVDSILVSIDLKNDVIPCRVIKYGVPAFYSKTYDDKTVHGTQTDRTWKQLLSDIKKSKAYGNAMPYKSYDLAVTELIPKKCGLFKTKTEYFQGLRFGHALSTSGVTNFDEFLEDARENRLDTSIVVVKITREIKTSTAGHTWGVLNFELKGFIYNTQLFMKD